MIEVHKTMKVFIIVQVLFVLIDCIVAANLTWFNVGKRKTENIGRIESVIMISVNVLLVEYFELHRLFLVSTVVTVIGCILFGYITSFIVGNLKGD